MEVTGFQASGQCLTEFTYGNNLNGNQTYSATSLGETYEIAVENMYAALNTLVDNYFMANPSFQKTSVNYSNVGAWPAGPPKLTLYYKLDIVNGISVDSVKLYPNSSLFENGTRHMTNENYIVNENIINFTGYNSPSSIALDLPPTYGETFTILIPSNGSQVSAQALYIDFGSIDIITTVPFALFNISSASGIFEGYTVVKVNYDNTDTNIYKRQVEFY